MMMRLRRLAYSARRPATLILSLAVATVVFLPSEGALSEIPQPTLQRVVATPKPAPVFEPLEMTIPKLELNAPIVPVGTEADGTMGSPTNGVDVGWWFGRKPGEGNALFAAHRDWSGRPGSFARLKDLVPGDEFIVRGQDGSATYRVVWVRNFDRNVDATDLLGNDGGGQIATLITCDGPFDRSIGTARERVVARAELVSA